jgi:DNA-binding transcriptional ArsR family regulator
MTVKLTAAGSSPGNVGTTPAGHEIAPQAASAPGGGYLILDPLEPGEVHARPHLHPGVVGVLEALGDPMRMAVIRRLASGIECSCGGLGLPISKSTLTHHLHILKAAGVVIKREEGTRRMISLDREGMERRYPGLLDAVLAAPDSEAPAEV